MRIALILNNIPFEDNRISLMNLEEDWFGGLKPKTKYGSVPILEVDGEEYHQSGSILRLIWTMGDGSLYPSGDYKMTAKIEEMINLADEWWEKWNVGIWLGFGFHAKYAHPTDWPAKDEELKGLRATFVKDELPRFLGHVTSEIKSSGGPFICGAKPTIADIQWFCQVHELTYGTVHGAFMPPLAVATDVLDDYPDILAWLDAVKGLVDSAPEISSLNK